MLRLPDSLFGVLFVVLGVVAVVWGRAMPPMIPPAIGPGLLPMICGAGFVLFGAALVVQGLPELGAIRAGRLSLWEPRPNPWFPAVVLVALVVYVVALPVAGFLATTVLFVAVVVRASGGGIVASLVFAAAVTLLLHLVFVHLFRVPLPPGLVF